MLDVVTEASAPRRGEDDTRSPLSGQNSSRCWRATKGHPLTRGIHVPSDFLYEIPHFCTTLRILKAQGIINAIRLSPYNKCVFISIDKRISKRHKDDYRRKRKMSYDNGRVQGKGQGEEEKDKRKNHNVPC